MAMLNAERRCAAPWLASALLCLLAAACSAPGLVAQTFACHGEGQDQPISTDRPTFANASTVVPCHSLQLESGLLVSSEAKQRGYDLPELTLRYGLTKTTELRATVPDYDQNYGTGGSFVTGLGDTGLGFKQMLAATKSGFNLAAIAGLTLPTGVSEVSSHGYDPTLQIVPSQKLSQTVTLAGQLSVAWPTQGAERNVTGGADALVDWNLKNPADVFVEYAGVYPGSGTPQHTIDFGALYRPTKTQQLDVHSGFGLSATATDRFVGMGYSIRFDL